ncbi:hypothetical protein FRB94_007768 [Tulasnella sp. JGI-2019a]|nr:hypothetical protein FRB94_007768 [Tulasnella sp. JGI-2019a]KAG9028111.1 hypothetical protein FRB95_006835 [Tulasnella sp. JGI-2019a]
MGARPSIVGQDSDEPPYAASYSTQWLALAQRMEEVEEPGKIREIYLNGRPAAPGWDLHQHPIWHEAPYFVNLLHRIVASHCLLSDPFHSTKQRDRAIANLLKVFYAVTAEVGPAPRYCEIAFSPGSTTAGARPYSLQHRDSGVHIPRKRIPVNVVFVDHQRKFASSVPNDLVDDGHDKPPRVRKWTYSDDSMLHEVTYMPKKERLLRAQYWSYVATYPHYYLHKTQDSDDASKEACLAIAELHMDRRKSRKSPTSYLSDEPKSQPDTLSPEACRTFLDEIKLLRSYENSIGMSYGRRIVRVARFLADYYTHIADDWPNE